MKRWKKKKAKWNVLRSTKDIGYFSFFHHVALSWEARGRIRPDSEFPFEPARIVGSSRTSLLLDRRRSSIGLVAALSTGSPVVFRRTRTSITHCRE